MNAIQRKPSHFQPCGCDKCTIESLRKQLATAKLEGFNEGIEAAANILGNGFFYELAMKTRTLKREVK